MAVEATEKWVRERVKLNYEHLGDVRSLSLPGSYHEKITVLGTALQSFERLKNLDLSRNSLTSLEGLDHLSVLETLNLYYNNISSLQDLFLLRHNNRLQELDLRLNPVTKNEPDYRLFVVHMLPNLRKLDDRSVRDSERKAALLHFNSEQANELTEHFREDNLRTKTERVQQPRAEYIRGMSKKTSVVEDDDSELLDLIARTGGDLRQARHLSGSAAIAPSIEHHERNPNTGIQFSKETHATIDNQNFSSYGTYVGLPPAPSRLVPAVATECRDLHDRESYSREGLYGGYEDVEHCREIERDSHLYSKHPIQGTTQAVKPHSPSRQRTRVQFQDDIGPRETQLGDPNLKFTDETDAYTSYKTTGHFTPNPKSTETDSRRNIPPNPRMFTSIQDKQTHLQLSEMSDRIPDDRVMTSPRHRPVEGRLLAEQRDTYKPVSMPSNENSSSSEKENSIDSVSDEFLVKFLNLVDRYWNGSKSLHKHQKFQGQARTMLSNFVSDVTADSQHKADMYQKDLAKFAQENVGLRGQLTNTVKEHSQNQINHEGLQNALQLAQEDVEVLKEKLNKAKEENQVLKGQVSSISIALPTVQDLKSSELQNKHISVLEDENENLQREIDKMRLQLKHYTQLQELTNMLQESHKSLVTTNDHLLQELNETKDRHSNEVKQLHWSYSELKRTMDIIPKYSTSQGPSSSSFMSDPSRRYNGDVLT
ncbi:centrosomal protein of 72 kDa-like [Antedon mediterranea]|uniref:centrosomal protein of 72 kDa-like n=1 Tax=Antedon mediterranea TaxID=105859 RepID=UPI003AF9AE73